MANRRVAVTGIGLICALGLDRESSWQALCEGRCGIADLTQFDATGCRSRKVAEVPPYDAGAWFTPLERRRYSRSDQLAVIAAEEALADAGVLDAGIDRSSVGVIMGVGSNDLPRSEAYFAAVVTSGYRFARPSLIANYLSDAPVDALGRRFSLTGLRACTNSACSSSLMAIGYGADLIRAGKLTAALCGGGDALCRTALAGFNALRVVDVEPCRPFDVNRNGMNLGEAGAVLFLENLDHAQARGAHVYVEVAGYAANCEAYHATAPEPEGVAVAALLHSALASGGIPPVRVDHINAHGTGTPQNDRTEARGIRRVFGERAGEIPVTSIKSMIGHCLGAAGAIEAAALALTIERGVIPPTVNHRQTDPECQVDVVANRPRVQLVACGISTSLAFGGNDAAVVFTRTT